MSNAERQRKFRENRDRDTARRQVYLDKEKQRYLKDKKSGKKKSVKDMTEREKRSARKYWRTQKQKQKEAKKTIEQCSFNIFSKFANRATTREKPDLSTKKAKPEKTK